ncbi:MAG: DHH family phosphoesterase [Erysipelothrix sp.]|nr:DHH family phosphoesterase [Erysipelothrix sp.]
MFKQLEQFQRTILIFFLIELSLIILGYVYFRPLLVFLLVVLLVTNGFLLFGVFLLFYQQLKGRTLSIQRVLGKEASEGFLYGGIGLVAFNESFEITWLNDIFSDQQLEFVGEKLTTWIKDLHPLLRNQEDVVYVTLESKYYQVKRSKEGQMLFFKDITEFRDASTAYHDNRIVLGLVHFDNYEEETAYEDEQKIATIDLQLTQPVVNWAKEHGIYLRRIRSDRFLLVLTEKIYNRLLSEGFSILGQIRRNSNKYDFSITLSMAFALGTNDLTQLEEMANKTLELSQGRGGDQVAVKRYGQDIRYYGGGSEAQEKGSKVRVRVLSHTLRELLLNASNVIIVGHKVMDFDCFGAAIGISRMVQNLKKPVSIVTYSGGIEKKLNQAIELYQEDLSLLHNLIDEDQALRELQTNTLVIMVDHHSLNQSNAPKVIERASKVAIIDHHRRTADFEFNPIFAYIETSSSSTSEMVTEFFVYQSTQIELKDIEATIMFAGILIDTNNFSARTGARTFETAAILRSLGADPTEADNLLKEDFQEFDLRTEVLSKAERVGNYVVVPYEQQVLSRAMISIVANNLLKIQGIEASFVISPLSDDRVGISARSKGNFNVQAVMEAMGGGGHFTMAAVQKEKTTVSAMREELSQAIAERENMEV